MSSAYPIIVHRDIFL